MGALTRLRLPTCPNHPPHPPPTRPPPIESIRDIKGADKLNTTKKTSGIQVACRNSYKMIAICDRLCENPPCLHANFDLFLQFQNSKTFT